jgi:phosphoribosylaminoimidazole carboxylase (NCAIR synthetase)
LIPNPLTNTPTPTLQLPLQYIKTYVKTGVVAGPKDVEEIDRHLNGAVVKKAVEGLYDGEGEVVMQKAGLTK